MEHLNDNDLDRLTQRYIELRKVNRKIHLCIYYFRQKCLKLAENCQFAHGISDMTRLPPQQLKEIKKELFSIKSHLQAMKKAVLFNWQTREYEVYTYEELEKLKQELIQKGIDSNDIVNNEVIAELIKEDEERKKMTMGQIERETTQGKKFSKLKKTMYGHYESQKAQTQSQQEEIKVQDHDQIEEIGEQFDEVNICDQSEQIDTDDILLTSDRQMELERLKQIEEEKLILRPWQVKITAEFMRLLFQEVGQNCILYKSIVIKKFIEAGVPLTWNKLCSAQVVYEKKTCFPPWNLKRSFILVLPINDVDQNNQVVQKCATQIITQMIDDQKENFKLPIQVTEISKIYHKIINLRDPPLFIVAKQQCQSLEGYFYRILETNETIKYNIVQHLKSNYSEFDWAQNLIEKIDIQQYTLFLPTQSKRFPLSKIFHEELEKRVFVNGITQVETLYNHLRTKFSDSITKDDHLEKIVPISFLKLQYRIIKLGSANIFLNEFHQQQQDIHTILEYSVVQCSLCLQNPQTISSISTDNIQQFEEIQYIKDKNNKILIVNDENTLSLASSILRQQESVGVDLEGRLKRNGYIVLLQLGCADEVVIIFDIYMLEQDLVLMEKAQNVLSFIFMNESIRKVFFDGRKDIEALHFILNIGVRNSFDIQAVHMLFCQLKELKKNRKHYEIKGVNTPGLNDVLKRYPVKNGVNTFKDKFKEIFNDFIKTNEIFYNRPLNPEFISYAAQDVQDLSQLADILTQNLMDIAKPETTVHYWQKVINKVSLSYAQIACKKFVEYGVTHQINQ
ncbi:3-5 exonuclease family protein [Stylonychia lemnae]|uniref:3-5 exonuclease family protein n=1 Tax=Stylonychia lemnae TaxID=5949 RepID=A0A078AAD0_STYLE|nr:3-5 exonuclease family protein [Stylonychia lemnae]|eukprot:CDW77758.1 3-5 exonuclease family protein [Stylonychia lemnae]